MVSPINTTTLNSKDQEPVSTIPASPLIQSIGAMDKKPIHDALIFYADKLELLLDIQARHS
jgi:hypothetical protein